MWKGQSWHQASSTLDWCGEMESGISCLPLGRATGVTSSAQGGWQCSNDDGRAGKTINLSTCHRLRDHVTDHVSIDHKTVRDIFLASYTFEFKNMICEFFHSSQQEASRTFHFVKRTLNFDVSLQRCSYVCSAFGYILSRSFHFLLQI